jgi:hypothetical protein
LLFEEYSVLDCCAVQSGRSLLTFSDVLAASIIALMIGATSTCETSVNFYQTARRNIPENSHFLLAAVSMVFN